MRPTDIDWQEATLLVRGKGRRDVRLPLPQDAGDAVLDYIEHARPQVAIDRLFLCAKAPFRPLRSGMIVSGIVRAADEPLFHSLMEQFHYLRYEQPVGEHLKLRRALVPGIYP